MEYRKAIIEDANDIYELLKGILKIHAKSRPDVFKNNSSKYSLIDVENIINDPSKLVFVANENNKVIGYAICMIHETKNHISMYDSKQLFIDDFCISENYQRKHIGTNLYQCVKKYAKENGFDKITLHVLEFNTKAIEFYKSLGMDIMYMMMEDKIN